MTRGKGKIHKEDRSYTQGELADIDGQIRDIDAQIKEVHDNPGSSRAGQINIPGLKKQRAYLDGVRHENAPKTPRSGVKKDSLWNEAKQLETELKVGMPTREEMNHPATHMGAVHKHLNWDKRNQGKILRYKEIMRNLNPQDPTAMDLERFRKQGEIRR